MASCIVKTDKNNNLPVRKLLQETEKRLPAIKKNKDILRSTYLKIAETYELIKEPLRALSAYKLFSAISDSLLNKEKFQQINELHAKYETEKKEKQIQLQKSKIEWQNSVLSQKKLQLTTVIAVFAFLIAFGLLFYFRYESRQKMRFLMEVQRQEKMMETALGEKEKEERDRISKDIHDELGSGLSKISLIAEYSKQHIGENKILGDNIAIISKTTQLLAENMRELIWALNSSDDTLDYLAAHLYEYGSEYLEDLPVRAQFSFPEEVPSIKISKPIQRNIFLTFKEALNNSVKHAEASMFHIQFGVAKSCLTITLADNGKGFELDKIRKTGNGLHNMKHRIEQIGGELTIITSPCGTSVTIQLELEMPMAETTSI